MRDNDFQATTEYIKTVNQSLNEAMKVPTKHHYQLRRCLLKCDYYHQNKVKRFFCRLAMNSCIVFRSGMLLLIIGGGIIIHYHTKPIDAVSNFSPVTAHTVEVKSDAYEPEYLQDLYEYGYLKYSHEMDTGCRVYTALIENQPVTIYDHKPYEINLVMAH